MAYRSSRGKSRSSSRPRIRARFDSSDKGIASRYARNIGGSVRIDRRSKTANVWK